MSHLNRQTLTVAAAMCPAQLPQHKASERSGVPLTRMRTPRDSGYCSRPITTRAFIPAFCHSNCCGLFFADDPRPRPNLLQRLCYADPSLWIPGLEPGYFCWANVFTSPLDLRHARRWIRDGSLSLVPCSPWWKEFHKRLIEIGRGLMNWGSFVDGIGSELPLWPFDGVSVIYCWYG